MRRPGNLAAGPATGRSGGWYTLGYDKREVEADDGGNEDGDAQGDAQGGDSPGTRTVAGDTVMHISADGSEVTTVWISWDEFPYAGVSMGRGAVAEYPHTNSVTVDRNTGNLLLSMLLADALAMVDPATGLAVWTMGGADSDWEFEADETFAHQHSPLLIDGGRQLALFDDGAGDSADSAEAAVYDLDWGTFQARRTWSYDEQGEHVGLTTGSVAPVNSGGSLLVAGGSDASLSQVSQSGELEWEVGFLGDTMGYSSHLTLLGGESP